jgi:hypothetical protein
MPSNIFATVSLATRRSSAFRCRVIFSQIGTYCNKKRNPFFQTYYSASECQATSSCRAQCCKHITRHRNAKLRRVAELSVAHILLGIGMPSYVVLPSSVLQTYYSASECQATSCCRAQYCKHITRHRNAKLRFTS